MSAFWGEDQDAVHDAFGHRLQEEKKRLIQRGSYTEGAEKLSIEQQLQSTSFTQIKIINPSNLQTFVTRLAELMPEVLPIDIALNIDQEDTYEVFSRAKYAIKYDNKGWANNASSLISLLPLEYVLYTNWGMCTDKKITLEPYDQAIVLPKTKYSLREGEHLTPDDEIDGKHKCFGTKNKMPDKKNWITPQMIIQDIEAREKNREGYCSEFLISTGCNQKTLEAAQRLLQAEFNPSDIAQQLILDLHTLYNPPHIIGEGNEKTCLTFLSGTCNIG